MSNVSYPVNQGIQNAPSSTKNMIERGQDPKEMLIQFCKPECKFWEDKLKRCEIKLKELAGADPEKTCMYPLRDWVTCVEGCVNL